MRSELSSLDFLQKHDQAVMDPPFLDGVLINIGVDLVAGGGIPPACELKKDVLELLQKQVVAVAMVMATIPELGLGRLVLLKDIQGLQQGLLGIIVSSRRTGTV
ncbi:hypothetical protein B5F88_02340 [Flavonifractor sp. An306]|nr:hypothetical protein B5F88_02340 [Flavonifractor sp. An306]